MNKKTAIVSLISSLTVLLLLLVAYKSFSVNEKNNNNVNNNQINNDEVKVYSSDEINKILINQDEILYTSKNIKDLTHAERTYIAYKLYRDEVEKVPSEFTISDLEEYYSKSIYSHFKIKFQNIPGASKCNSPIYNLDGKKYIQTNEGICSSPYPLYRKMVSMDRDGDKYIVNYQYVFYRDDGPNNHYLYYTPEDFNENKSFKTIEIAPYYERTDTYPVYNYDKMRADAKKYIEDNYDEIKIHLTTYVYTFESTRDGLLLTDFKTK